MTFKLTTIQPFSGSHREHRLPAMSHWSVEFALQQLGGIEPEDHAGVDCDHEYFFAYSPDERGDLTYRCSIWRMSDRSEWSAYGPRECFERLGLL